MLLVGVLAYALASALIVRIVLRPTRRGLTGRDFWRGVVVMMTVTLITAAAHLAVIACWALALLLCRGLATFEDAFYISAENYTALGYGDIMLPARWRLLGPLEAINGLLLFGISTALMFAVMQHLIMNRLRRDANDQPEP
jgi:hypothetical protein